MQRQNKPEPWASMRLSISPQKKLSEGVRRITEGYGSDVVIDAMGGDILSEALGTLAMSGSLTTLGYSAGRKSTIDVTDLIWSAPV
jgi:NADPH:quinone reductase